MLETDGLNGKLFNILMQKQWVKNPMGHKIFMLLGHKTFSAGNILKYLEI